MSIRCYIALCIVLLCGFVNTHKAQNNQYGREFWEYDSRAIRRWEMDPRPNRSMSPYSVFAGNPIMFKDHLGDTVQMQNTTGFFLFRWLGLGGTNDRVNYINGQLLSQDGTQYKKELSSDVQFITQQLNTLDGDKEGSKLLRDLNTGPFSINNVLIEVGEIDNTRPNDAVGGNDGKGTGSTITLSRDNAKLFGDMAKSSLTPIVGYPFLNLGHELAHARDITYGINDRSVYSTHTYLNGSSFNFRKSEIRAVYIENKIRASMGFPLRAYYDIDEDKNGKNHQFMSPRLLDSNGKPFLHDPNYRFP